MSFSKPRTKFYGCQTVYAQAAADLLRFRIHRGGDVDELQRRVAQHFGARFAIATPLARMGIYLCLKHFLRDGQLVLQSPYTLAEVINMTVCAGGRPLFSDVDANNGHLNPASLRYQQNIGAMLVTHLHGIPADMNALMDFAREHSIPVIEDAAQSAGTKYDGRYVGTIGDAGVLSFGILKQLNSVYGGMVLTNDGDLAHFVRHELERYRDIPVSTLLDKLTYLIRMHAMATNPFFSWLVFPMLRFGVTQDVRWINNLVAVQPNIVLKTKLDDWYRHRYSACQARMLAPQLQRLATDDARRSANAQRYIQGLSGIDGLTLPAIPKEAEATFAHFPVQVSDPANLLRWFNFYGQDIVAQHFSNCAELPCFAEFAAPCPIASKVAQSLVLLPTYPGFEQHDVERNINILRAYFAAGQPEFDHSNRLKL